MEFLFELRELIRREVFHDLKYTGIGSGANVGK